MSRAAQWVLAVSLSVAAGGAGFFLHDWWAADETKLAGRSAARDALFQTSLDDLSGRPQRIDQWRGKVLVVNFWATWCPPCREEIPTFIAVQERYKDRGLQVVGIAIDQREKVANFADEIGVNYPVLVGEVDAVNLGRQLGNRLGALPFTVFVDRAGNIARVELGTLDEARLNKILQPML